MKQSEYLRELEINLESRLSPAEIQDILSDYESFFAAGREEGKSDDNISEELGSPAYLAKTLLSEHDDGDSYKGSGKESYKESGSQSKTAAIPAANPGRRLCAYLMDSIIAVLPALIVSFVFMANALPAYMMLLFSPSPAAGTAALVSYSAYTVVKNETVGLDEIVTTQASIKSNRDVVSTQVYRKGLDGRWTSQKPNISAAVFAGISLAFYLLYSTVSTLLLKGQTIGKKLMGIQVRRSGKGQVSVGMIFFREFLGKVLLNSIPIVPIVSLFTILLTKEHKALHDMLADTIVTDI
jgi:uncharacterized membrane protein